MATKQVKLLWDHVSSHVKVVFARCRKESKCGARLWVYSILHENLNVMSQKKKKKNLKIPLVSNQKTMDYHIILSRGSVINSIACFVCDRFGITFSVLSRVSQVEACQSNGGMKRG